MQGKVARHMKLSGQEEYGLRCLLRLADDAPGGSLSIPQIAAAEGLSIPYVAKLMRLLRRGGFVRSTRGQLGGYTLPRPAAQITVGEVLAVLGGRIYDSDFCRHHTGNTRFCTNSVDCSIRPLWRTLQSMVDQVLDKTTLQDLLQSEPAVAAWAGNIIKVSDVLPAPPKP